MGQVARDRAEYIGEWRSHINQLVYPFLDSGTQWKEWEKARDHLLDIVFAAAAANFPHEGENDECC